MSEEERICFVIGPIGKEDSEIRRRSDEILTHIISPAAEHCGYKAIRADEVPEPGQITHQAIIHIREDPMLVADLTGGNPNVFYELAVRHMVRKPFVQLFQPMPQCERIPFDLTGPLTIFLNHPDWDSIPKSRDELIEAIASAEQRNPDEIITPIGSAIDLRALTESKHPVLKAIARIEEHLAHIRAWESQPRTSIIPRGRPMTKEELDSLLGWERPNVFRLPDEDEISRPRTA